MSRIGDLIKNQRTKYQMTPKQLAKKCGVSETFVLEVESGKRIPGDIIATRMLKAMGSPETALNDLDVQTSVSAPEIPTRPMPVRQKAAPVKTAPVEPSDAWKDALSGMIKRLPIYNERNGVIGHRMVALEDGRIEGIRPEQAFYRLVSDDTMRTYRLMRNDLLLCGQVNAIENETVMALTYQGLRLIRFVKKLEGNKAELRWTEDTQKSLVVPISELKDLAKVLRVEFQP